MQARQERLAPLIAALLATLFASWLYGWRVIDPSSAAWMLQGDPAQHYLGSVFFLGEPWHWPPGVITRFGEGATSVVFTDSIPLVALLAKLLGVRPGLQYFGLWMVLCHALAAWWGVQLLRRMGVARPVGLVAGGLFFTATTPLLFRAYGHEALMAQFFVLAALERALAPWKWLPWLVLAVAALLVHPYLAAMVCVLGTAAGLAALAEHSAAPVELLVRAAASGAVLLCVAWLAGFFAGSGEMSVAGFGQYSANLLAWLDPWAWVYFMRGDPVIFAQSREWSRWLPALKFAQVGQYEGFAYLGAGVLAAVAIALGAVALRRAPERTETRARWTAVLAASLALALLAVSTRPTFGATVLADIPLSPGVAQVLGIFRASGRFIWPLTYLLMAWSLSSVGRLRHGSALLVLLLLVQADDLFPKFKEFRIRFRTGPPHIEQPVSSPVWKEALARCPNLEMVSGPRPPGRLVGAALAAGLSGARFYPAPTARYSTAEAAARQETVKALLAGHGWRDDVVYVLAPPLPDGTTLDAVVASLPPKLRHITADGYDLAVPAACLEP